MDTIQVSKTGVGASSLIPLDQYLTLQDLTAFVIVIGTANYTIQYTLDQIFQPGFNPSTANWVDITNLATLSTNQRANLVGSARALRILVNSGTGSVTLTISDRGTTGEVVPLGIGVAGGGGGGITALSAGTTQVTGPTVSFANANNVSFGANGNTITASVIPGAGGGITAISGGTTSATGPTISFANGNNVTFGVNGNTVTASVAAGGGGGGAAISAAGNSVSNGTVAFSNSNGISFGMAGSTVTASHNGLTSQSNQAASAANGSFAFQTLSFSNANGFSFGTSAGSVITGSFAAGGQTNQTIGVYATSNTTGQSSSSTYDARSMTIRGYGILSVGNSNGSVLLSTPDPVVFTQLSVGNSTLGNTSGNTGLVTGQLVLAGGNNVTLSGSTNAGSMTITISAGAGGGGGGVGAGVSNLGNTAGSTGTVTTGNVVFVGSGPISLSQSTGAAGSAATISINGPAVSSLSATGAVSISTNGSTISIGVSNAVTLSGFGPYEKVSSVFSRVGEGTLVLQPQDFPAFQYDRVAFPMAMTNFIAGSGSHTVSFWMGIYTKNASTLSLVTSSSTTVGMTLSGTDGNYSLYSGYRNVTMPMTSTLSEGKYWLGLVSNTSSAGASSVTIDQGVFNPSTNIYRGLFNNANNASEQASLGAGVYSTTTGGIPSSIAFSQLSGNYNGGRPIVGFMSGTA